MTEFEFIRRYFSKQQHDSNVVLGIGDDAAIVRPKAGYDLHFSSDMLLAGRHFFEDMNPEDLAHKILSVNISDMAAMGAIPRWVLLNAALPSLDEKWLEAFSGSLFNVLSRYNISLIGGDTTKGDLIFSVTIIGETPCGKALRRDAAQNGDDIWVSGVLGSAAAALRHRLGDLYLPEAVHKLCEPALLRPIPRVDLGTLLLPLAHAAQDISDGLAQDLGHILTASAKGAILYADKVPVLPELLSLTRAGGLSWSQFYDCILAGGDDYELVFTAPPQVRAEIEQAGAASGATVRRVGQINNTGYLNIVDTAGKELVLAKKGFDHFG